MPEVKIEEFRQKPLRVHSFLAGVPLRTLARVDLPGDREGMTTKPEETAGQVDGKISHLTDNL
jgi:hypothetical protein